MNDHVEALGQVKATVIDLAIKFGPKVFVAIVIIVVGYIVGRQVGRIMARGLRKFDMEPPVRDLLVRIVRILVLGLFLIMALQNLGGRTAAADRGPRRSRRGHRIGDAGRAGQCGRRPDASFSPSRSGWANTSRSSAWKARWKTSACSAAS